MRTAPAEVPQHLVVVGDCLLDQDVDGRAERLASDAPVPVLTGPRARHRPGGAGLAACVAAAEGLSVRLVTALCRDAGGEQLRAMLGEAGVEVLDLGWAGTTPEKIRIRSAGQTLLRLDGGTRRSRNPGLPAAEVLRALATASAVVVSDYGYGVTDQARLRGAIEEYAQSGPVVWDPHPRSRAPIPGAHLVKPNRREAGGGDDLAAVAHQARELRGRWQARGVAVTLGADGALLVTDDDAPPLVAPAPAVGPHDSCGAGDRFTVAAARAIIEGSSLEEAVGRAVDAASRFVATGGAAVFGRDEDGERPASSSHGGVSAALQLATDVHARGGRLVATSGCFDLLHAGHVQMLEAARGLGDGLVVLLNSDRSVRGLKGPGRPMLAASDRARVLSALSCVDAVAIFDEPTPVPILEQLRPDVFAKGADYAERRLPEQEALSGWNGQVVVLPYLEGHSTTRLIQEVARHGAC